MMQQVSIQKYINKLQFGVASLASDRAVQLSPRYDILVRKSRRDRHLRCVKVSHSMVCFGRRIQ